MVEHRLWCWEVMEAGGGPDWLFIVHVAPSSAPALTDLAARATLEGFVRVDEGGLTLIDAGSHTAYARNLAGEGRQNIWVYNLARVQGDTLSFECGYGGRGEALSRAETALLLDILAAPGVALQSWRVLAGGEGYTYTVLREGADAASLRAYLSISQ